MTERNRGARPAAPSRTGTGFSRAAFLKLLAAAGAGVAAPGPLRAEGAATARLPTRPIPSSGEPVPIVGLGTWVTFHAGPSAAERAPLAQVLRNLFAAGGTLIDTAPMYANAEQVIGDLLAEAGAGGRGFLATKVMQRGRAAGIEEMRASMAELRREPLDLIHVHNLVDWRTQLATLRAWKAEGRVRHIGVTHYTASAHDELEAVLRQESVDVVQLNYAIDDRGAEARLLPLAAERGIAVIVNQPFRHRALIEAAEGRPLPGWASELGCSTWAQAFLKFILAHEAVTCVIPGTGDPAHMTENARAGMGPLPDRRLRERIAADWEAAA